jgi:hypothetical protein
MTSFEWLPIRYRNVISILKNPFYAGVYVYGKSEKRTEIVEGRARKGYGHGKPIGAWEVMIKDHHEGYISWAEYERNQKQLASNTYGWPGGAKSSRGGRALLSRMLTCGRCGRRLAVAYAGNPREPSGVLLRQAEPYDGPAEMHDLWRAARGRRNRQGAAQGGRADGDRGGVGGRTRAPRTTGRAAAHCGLGARAGALRGQAGGAPLCRLRSRQPAHRHPAREDLGGGGAAPGRGPAGPPIEPRAGGGRARRRRPRRSCAGSRGGLARTRRHHACAPAARAQPDRRDCRRRR